MTAPFRTGAPRADATGETAGAERPGDDGMAAGDDGKMTSFWEAPFTGTGWFGELRTAPTPFGRMVFAANDTMIGASIDAYGEWCGAETDLLRMLLAPGDVVVDVGANIGHHALTLAKVVEQPASVFAIEANLFNFQLLFLNTVGNGLDRVVVPLLAAASAEPGVVTITEVDPRQRANFGGASIVESRHGRPIPAVRLDDIPFPRPPRLIKVDVEGHEMSVLLGARTLLRTARPVLFVEADNDAQFRDLHGLLAPLGYHLHFVEFGAYRADNFRRNATDIFEGRGYSRNLLCIHADSGIAVTGLRRAASAEDGWRPGERARLANVTVSGAG